VREAAARSQSRNNLKQISLGMMLYAEDNDGRIPPAASRDEDGRPLLSWRVLLLPYLDLEERKLYNEFHLDEPWDSPHNLKLLPRIPHLYQTPHNSDVTTPPGTTFYQVFIGPDTPFEIAAGPRFPLDFNGKTSGTIVVVEAGEAVPWTKPQDIEYDPNKPLPTLGGVFSGPGRFRVLPSDRRQGAHVAMADGSTRFVEASMPEHAWRWAISRTTTEPQPREW
jgi:hypothetical protein